MHTIDYTWPINRQINMAVQGLEFLLFIPEAPASNPNPQMYFS